MFVFISFLLNEVKFLHYLDILLLSKRATGVREAEVCEKGMDGVQLCLGNFCCGRRIVTIPLTEKFCIIHMVV